MIGQIVNETAKKFYLQYVLGLLLCTTRKTCTQMGQSTELGHDALWRALKQISKNEGIQEGLIEAALSLLNRKNKWWLILDDTMILKPHAKKLQKLVLDRCGATSKVEKRLVAIFLCITDGEIVCHSCRDYMIRWGIEIFFRSAKQSLGIQHCASPDIAIFSFIHRSLKSRFCISPDVEFEAKWTEHIQRDHKFIAYLDDKPIAYLQYYHVTDEDRIKFHSVHIPEPSVGCDLFIGDPEYLGKGYGTELIRQFIQYMQTVEPTCKAVIIDSASDNYRAIACYKKVWI